MAVPFPSALRRFLAAGLPLLLAACAAGPRVGEAPSATDLALPGRAEPRCGEEKAPPDVVLHLQLIEDMQRQGLYHAALAHLDALGKEGARLPRARFLRAESLRHMGAAEEARTLFKGLTDSCLAGLGHHGLARLEVDAGRIQASLTHFANAERQRPTDPRIRNDHGYALLLAGRTGDARRQFQTAYELGGGERAAANLMLALLVADEKREAAELSERLGLSSQELKRLRDDADALRQNTRSKETRP
ncbi:MAG: hypothetical protein AB7U81_02585 [Thiohalomonadaceae bacterium]